MSKIQTKVLDQHHLEEKRSVSASRSRPPEAVSLRGGKSQSKLQVLKAITESVLIGEDEQERADGVEGKRNSGNFIWRQLEVAPHKFVLLMMYVLFGLYRYFKYQYNMIRLWVYGIIYNPSNTPQLIRQDVTKLSKIPKRLAAILEMKPVGEVGGGLKGLLNDASEVVCWTTASGIRHLMLYDYDGVLKDNLSSLRKEIKEKLTRYYGPSNTPSFAVRIPHLNKVFYNVTDQDDESQDSQSHKVSIEVSLLSNRDGRETIVDLTKIMSELCQSQELKLSDISMNLIDTELTQLVGHEPDLLLYFGPSLDLQGFPPWHIRLTEFYWEEDNNNVSYVVFIKGLQKYASCKINVGK